MKWTVAGLLSGAAPGPEGEQATQQSPLVARLPVAHLADRGGLPTAPPMLGTVGPIPRLQALQSSRRVQFCPVPLALPRNPRSGQGPEAPLRLPGALPA